MNASIGKLLIRILQVIVGSYLVYQFIFVTRNYVFAVLAVAFLFVWSCRLYLEIRARNSNGGTP